jgi:hypothetical protein
MAAAAGAPFAGAADGEAPPMWGSARSVDEYEKIEQIGEGTYGQARAGWEGRGGRGKAGAKPPPYTQTGLHGPQPRHRRSSGAEAHPHGQREGRRVKSAHGETTLWVDSSSHSSGQRRVCGLPARWLTRRARRLPHHRHPGNQDPAEDQAQERGEPAGDCGWRGTPLRACGRAAPAVAALAVLLATDLSLACRFLSDQVCLSGRAPCL